MHYILQTQPIWYQLHYILLHNFETWFTVSTYQKVLEVILFQKCFFEVVAKICNLVCSINFSCLRNLFPLMCLIWQWKFCTLLLHINFPHENPPNLIYNGPDGQVSGKLVPTRVAQDGQRSACTFSRSTKFSVIDSWVCCPLLWAALVVYHVLESRWNKLAGKGTGY